MKSLKFSQILVKKYTFVILSFFLQTLNVKLSKYFSTLTKYYLLLIVSWLKLIPKKKKKGLPSLHMERENNESNKIVNG
jgi:hypothetical protein